DPPGTGRIVHLVISYTAADQIGIAVSLKLRIEAPLRLPCCGVDGHDDAVREAGEQRVFDFKWSSFAVKLALVTNYSQIGTVSGAIGPGHLQLSYVGRCDLADRGK